MIAIKKMKYLEIKLRIVQDFHEGNFRIPLSYIEEDKEMKTQYFKTANLPILIYIFN